MRPTVTNEDEANGQFNEFVYQKGGRVVGLLRESIGAKIWDETVANYLRQYSLKSTNTERFIEFFQNSSSEFSVEDFVESWTAQESNPLIRIVRTYNDKDVAVDGIAADDDLKTSSNITYSASIDASSGSGPKSYPPIIITQRSLDLAQENNTWTIRLVLDYLDVETNLMTSRVFWMSRNESVMKIEGVPASQDSYVIARSDALSLHDYDERNWHHIIGEFVGELVDK